MSNETEAADSVLFIMYTFYFISCCIFWFFYFFFLTSCLTVLIMSDVLNANIHLCQSHFQIGQSKEEWVGFSLMSLTFTSYTQPFCGDISHQVVHTQIEISICLRVLLLREQLRLEGLTYL